MMKTDKTATAVTAPDHRVWCEVCSIRIAPNEEQVEKDSKTYHQRCYTKLKPSKEKAIV